MARDYPGALVVLGGVSGELEQLTGEVSNPRRFYGEGFDWSTAAR